VNASLMPDDISSDWSYIYWGDGNGIKRAEPQYPQAAGPVDRQPPDRAASLMRDA